MIGGVAVREAPDSMFILPANGSNMSDVVDVAARDAKRVQVAVVLTTLVGIIQVSLKKTKQTPHIQKVRAAFSLQQRICYLVKASQESDTAF